MEERVAVRAARGAAVHLRRPGPGHRSRGPPSPGPSRWWWRRTPTCPPPGARGRRRRARDGWPASPPPTTTGRCGRASRPWPGCWQAAGHRAAVLCDDSRLVDRAAAVRAGVGWWGKSTMVLAPGHGPWLLLGSVVTDASLPPDTPMARDCGTCAACLPACPTGALVAPGVLDARRCLAALAQSPGAIPREFRRAMGDRLYGCDDCLEACPPGQRARLAARRRRRGAGRPARPAGGRRRDPAAALRPLLPPGPPGPLPAAQRPGGPGQRRGRGGGGGRRRVPGRPRPPAAGPRRLGPGQAGRAGGRGRRCGRPAGGEGDPAVAEEIARGPGGR